MATSTEIADVLVHPVVVRRLLGVLRSEGIVESRSGPKGGWAIARDPRRITLGGVYRAMAGSEPVVVTPAALDEAILAAEEAYVLQLERVTLADVLGADARDDPIRNRPVTNCRAPRNETNDVVGDATGGGGRAKRASLRYA